MKKRVRLAPNGSNLELFQIRFTTFCESRTFSNQIQYILLAEPKCIESDLKMFQIRPIWGNFGPQSDMLG